MSKLPESLEGGTTLRLWLNTGGQGRLMFSRDNEISELESVAGVNKQFVFSICLKLLKHYPVAGWLQLACSFIKRMRSKDGWGDAVRGWVLGML